MTTIPNVGIWPHELTWNAPILLRHLKEEGTCAIAHGIRNRSISVRMTEAELPGHPIIDERLDLDARVDGAIPFEDLLPGDMGECQAWRRLLGHGRFDIEYRLEDEPIGRISIDARSRPISMVVASTDLTAMTMRIRVDGQAGSLRSINCRTLDKDDRVLDDVASTFGNEGWWNTEITTVSCALTIRIHQSTTSVILIDTLARTNLLALPVAPLLLDTQRDLPEPPWSIDDLSAVLEVVRRRQDPWLDRRLRLNVSRAMDSAGDTRVKVFLRVLNAWLRRLQKDVETVDPQALDPTQLDAAATMWLDLAMEHPVPPDPRNWEQVLRDADTECSGRLLHVFESLRQGLDTPCKHGVAIPPCRIRNRRLTQIAGFLEQP